MEACAHSQRAEARCLRCTGIGWFGSVPLSSVRRRCTSASRHEFGDFGLIFTLGATFALASLFEEQTEWVNVTCDRWAEPLHPSSGELTAVSTVLRGEEGRAGPIWTSSLSSQGRLRLLAAEIGTDLELPDRSGHDRRKETTFPSGGGGANDPLVVLIIKSTVRRSGSRGETADEALLFPSWPSTLLYFQKLRNFTLSVLQKLILKLSFPFKVWFLFLCVGFLLVWLIETTEQLLQNITKLFKRNISV